MVIRVFLHVICLWSILNYAVAADTTIRGHAEVNGAPLVGGLVYVLGLGSALTATDGTFVIEGAQTGIEYRVLFQRSGTAFPDFNFVAGVGDYLQAKGAALKFNVDNCPYFDVTLKLNAAASAAVELRNMTFLDLTTLQPKSKQGTKGKIRIAQQLYRYLIFSHSIPDVVLQCPKSFGCQIESIRRRKAHLIRDLNNLRAEAELVNRVLRFRGVRKGHVSKKQILKIIKINREGRRQINRIPNKGWSCN